jgi:hypothetical protein
MVNIEGLREKFYGAAVAAEGLLGISQALF